MKFNHPYYILHYDILLYGTAFIWSVCRLSLLHENALHWSISKKLEKLAALFFDRFLVTETVTEGLVEPEVVERCRDNYNIELDQQLQEAIRSRLSLATFQGLKAYPKRGKGPYPKKATQKGDFFWADSHPNK